MMRSRALLYAAQLTLESAILFEWKRHGRGAAAASYVVTTWLLLSIETV